MADFRGRPFAYVALTLSVWVGARIVMSMDDNAAVGPSPLRTAAFEVVPITPAAVAWAVAFSNNSSKISSVQPNSRPRFHPISTNNGLPPAQDPWQDGGRPPGFSLFALVADKDEPQSAGRDTPPSKSLALLGEAGPPEQSPQQRKGWGGEVYAYSFWRFSNHSGSALAPNAQYGGSQSGIIAIVDPFGAPDSGLGLLARASATPDGNEREVALGFRWRPAKNWPLTLSAERRFRVDAPDRFAAYLAGGVNARPIAAGWLLDAFGQAGYAAGESSGGFFDAQARLTHPIAKISGVPLSAGTGAWAGGQKGATRVDIGPTLAAKVDTGPAKMLIQLDWRIRAAGNAEPQNGLALTVSTGF